MVQEFEDVLNGGWVGGGWGVGNEGLSRGGMNYVATVDGGVSTWKIGDRIEGEVLRFATFRILNVV